MLQASGCVERHASQLRAKKKAADGENKCCLISTNDTQPRSFIALRSPETHHGRLVSFRARARRNHGKSISSGQGKDTTTASSSERQNSKCVHKRKRKKKKKAAWITFRSSRDIAVPRVTWSHGSSTRGSWCCVEASLIDCYLRDSGLYVHESCYLGTERHPLTYVDRRRFWYGPQFNYGS
jgi:hypothetical protein